MYTSSSTSLSSQCWWGTWVEWPPPPRWWWPWTGPAWCGPADAAAPCWTRGQVSLSISVPVLQYSSVSIKAQMPMLVVKFCFFFMPVPVNKKIKYRVFVVLSELDKFIFKHICVMCIWGLMVHLSVLHYSKVITELLQCTAVYCRISGETDPLSECCHFGSWKDKNFWVPLPRPQRILPESCCMFT